VCVAFIVVMTEHTDLLCLLLDRYAADPKGSYGTEVTYSKNEDHDMLRNSLLTSITKIASEKGIEMATVKVKSRVHRRSGDVVFDIMVMPPTSPPPAVSKGAGAD
jgi:hypothetical protein